MLLFKHCPGRLVGCWNERVVVLGACASCQALWPFPGVGPRELRRRELGEDSLARPFRLFSHVFKGAQGSPTQLQENAPVFPTS